MSTPEIPSTSAWWVLQISAKRSVGELVDEPDLPQRLLAVELLGEHAPRERAAAGPRRGRGQRRVADVVAGVEVRVVDPHRPRGAERREREPLAVARHEVQAALDPRDERVVVRRRALRRAGPSPRACVRRPSRGQERRRRGRSAGRDSTSASDCLTCRLFEKPSTGCITLVVTADLRDPQTFRRAFAEHHRAVYTAAFRDRRRRRRRPRTSSRTCSCACGAARARSTPRAATSAPTCA